MTDNTSDYTQDYTYPEKRYTCLLDEGAITVSTAYDLNGKEQKVCTYASEIKENDWVAISNDTGNTYAATGGLLLVEKPVAGESLIIGRIKGLPGRGKVPPNDAAADTLAERLSGGYLRNAIVEILAFGAIVEGTFVCDGTNAQVPGVATKTKFSISQGYTARGLVMDGSGSGGANAIPLHYCPAGTDGDTYSCMFGITGLIPAME
jgi:hypothetical protein